jgi:hypothetical protein
MYENLKVDRFGKRTAVMDRGAGDQYLDVMEEKIIDLRKTLLGDSTAERWKEIKVELSRLESSLRSRLEARKRKLGHNEERRSLLVELR